MFPEGLEVGVGRMGRVKSGVVVVVDIVMGAFWDVELFEKERETKEDEYGAYDEVGSFMLDVLGRAEVREAE